MVKSIFRILIPLLLIFLLIFLFGNTGHDYNETRITTGHGPEDMALDLSNPRKPRIIISCTKRKGDDPYGKLQSYDINTEVVYDLTVNGYDASKLRPHGIYLQNRDSLNLLYVISHEKSDTDQVIDKIHQFIITGEQLTYQQSWTSDEYEFMDATNDLVVTDNGTIYSTNPTKVGFSEVPAVVGMIRPDRTSEVIASGLLYPNGIYANDNHLYVATVQDNTLFKYHLKPDGTVDEATREEAATIPGGDNITPSGNKILVANHPNLYKFVLHSMLGLKSPSSVYSYNTITGMTKQIYGPSTADISASSTAVLYDKYLYISQVFENYIIKIPLSELNK